MRDDDPVALCQNWHRQTLHMTLTVTAFIPTASGATIVIHQTMIFFLCKVSLCCYAMFLPKYEIVF